jgi:hypothetical protein
MGNSFWNFSIFDFMRTLKRFYGYIIILGIIWIPFFVYKLYELKNYNSYNGKVIRIEEKNVSAPKYNNRGSGYDKVYMPEVEFVKGNDTIVFLEGNRNLFAYFYNVGDTVTVLEDKRLSDKYGVLGFWYRMKAYEVIALTLVSGIIFMIYWGIKTGYFKE